MTAPAKGKVVLATRNAHKVVEMRRILAAAGLAGVDVVSVEVYPDVAEVPETGDTFEANALLKARAVAKATGEIAIADDSGLAVDALNGMPGVLSARWSGGLGDEANLRLVLAQVADVPDERLGASFECAAVAVLPNGEELVAHGSVRGSITRIPRGTRGFGYDPIFVPTGFDQTTAEMSDGDKDAISHRGIACRALAAQLAATDLAPPMERNRSVDHHSDPVDSEHADPQPVARLALDDVQLPVYDLADFNAADVARVSSFTTNFGNWQLPAEVAAALAVSTEAGSTLEWIHDTGELVLLGGVPTEGKASAEVTDAQAATGGNLPALLAVFRLASPGSGMVRQFFHSETMPEGSRVAVLAHIAHGPAVHELLWGWHREHGDAEGWPWLVERLATLEGDSEEGKHLA